MLTQAQFEQLPSLLQTIVQADRQIRACRKPVITIAEARELQGKIRHRRDLSKRAHDLYGNQAKGRAGAERR